MPEGTHEIRVGFESERIRKNVSVAENEITLAHFKELDGMRVTQTDLSSVTPAVIDGVVIYDPGRLLTELTDETAIVFHV